MKIQLEGTREEVMDIIHRMTGAQSVAISVEPTIEPTIEPERVECPGSFRDLIWEWAENFDEDGRKHWEEEADTTVSMDRGDHLRGLGSAAESGKILRWIAQSGGLTQAINVYVPEEALARAIAVNMAQVASIVFPEIADLLEHYDPLEG